MANFRNPYQQTLELANNDLKAYNTMLSLYQDEDGNYSIDIVYGTECETYAENNFENELDNLIIEAWHYALEKVNPQKKMFAIVKNCNYDFNIEIKVCAVTDNEDNAKIIFENEVENEKDMQVKGDINYDTENRTETYYEAYNEGYEATDGVRIFIQESPYYDKIS